MRAHRVRGFTLLELMISLALSGLLLALLSQAIGGVQQAYRTADQALSPDADSRRGQAMFTLLMSAALPGTRAEGSARFVGSPQAVEFTAAPPLALAEAGPLRVRMVVEPSSASQVGVYVELGAAGSGLAGQPRQLLMGNLSAARFEFAEAADSAVTQTWDHATKLPGLVRLNLERQGTAQPIVVAVRRNQVGGCRLDPVSLTCRLPDGR